MSPRSPGGSDGPYLVLAAFWQETSDVRPFSDALSSAHFPRPRGFPRGAVVTFRREVALGAQFRRDLARFDLTEPYAELEDSP